MAQVSYGTITITDITDIESIQNWYLATNSSSGVTKNTTGWTSSIQQMDANKQYLWNYEQILGTGNVEISSTEPTIIGHYGVNGQPGVEGNSIVSIDEYYQTTNSTTNPGSSGWTKNGLVVPTSTNRYLWNYQVINYSKTTAEGSYIDARIIGVYGDTGQRGSSILKVTTAPTSTSGTAGGFSYSYRMSLSTVKTQSGKSEVLIGDIVEYNSNHYSVGYVNSSYVYLSAATSIKGADGPQGVSVTGVKEIYFLKRTSDSTPNAPTDGTNITSTSTSAGIWTTAIPNYISGAQYYTSIQTLLSSGTSPIYSPARLNNGLTDANQKALDAYNTSTARDTEVNALKAQAKHYWWDSQGAHVAAGDNTTSVDNITQGTPSTYGFNSLMTPGYLMLKYKDINFVQLATNSLTFYRPATNGSTYVQGKKSMDLTSDALTFYKPLAYNSSNEPTAAAQLNANGLILSEGGIVAGTEGQSGFVYLSTQDYGSYSINSSSGISDWKEIIGTKFGVRTDGTLYASNVNISGLISATEGTIGGITIGSNYLTTNSSRTTYNATTLGLTITPSGIGAGNGSTNTFKVDASTGALTANSGTIGGWSFNSSYGLYTNSKTSTTSTNSGILIQKDGGIYAGAYSSNTAACPFQVTSAGALTAISGRIGKFTLSNTYLYTGSGSTQAGMGGDQAFWAGSNTSNSAPFRVSYAGVLNASGATIQGDVTVSKLTVSSGATISDTDGLINNDIVREETSQEIQDTYTSLSDNLDELQANLATTIDDLQELNTYSETEIERITQNVNEYLGANGYMLIEDQGLKITKGNFAVVITGTEILFQEDGNTVAWISGQKLYINRTEVTQSMKVGNFEWMIRTDGRLTLAYTGGN